MSGTSLGPGRRVAVVTGGNKGIGYAIVKSLCERLRATNDENSPVVVYLTAREEERGHAAVSQLNREGAYPSFHQLDIESKRSVRRFARFLKTAHGGLDIIVNNAGIAYFTRPETPPDIQARRTLDTNYFGTLNVCDELFPLLRAKSRVVNVSSGLGHLSKINGAEPASSAIRNKLCSTDLKVEELNELVSQFIEAVSNGTHRQAGWPNSAYGVSKVAVTALTRIQQRKFQVERPNDDIVVNSVHPGYVRTDLTGGNGIRDIEEGAEAPVYAALLGEDNGSNIPKGQFIWRDRTVVDWVDKKSIANKKD